MAKITRFQRSQKAHQRLIKKYDGAQYGFFGGNEQSLTKLVYHKNVYLEQDLYNKILSKQRKRELFKFAQQVSKN